MLSKRSTGKLSNTAHTEADKTFPLTALNFIDSESCPGCLWTQMQETPLRSYLDTRSRRPSASLLLGSM